MQVQVGILALSAALGRVEMSEAVPGGGGSSKFACPLQTASATNFSCLPPAPVSLGKVTLKQLLAFMFCLDGGCAYILLPCNINPTCQRDLALDWDPETQQSTGKKKKKIFQGFSYVFTENVEAIVQGCLMRASNTEMMEGPTDIRACFSPCYCEFLALFYTTSCFMLVSTIRRIRFRSVSLSIALFLC